MRRQTHPVRATEQVIENGIDGIARYLASVEDANERDQINRMFRQWIEDWTARGWLSSFDGNRVWWFLFGVSVYSYHRYLRAEMPEAFR